MAPMRRASPVDDRESNFRSPRRASDAGFPRRTRSGRRNNEGCNAKGAQAHLRRMYCCQYASFHSRNETSSLQASRAHVVPARPNFRSSFVSLVPDGILWMVDRALSTPFRQSGRDAGIEAYANRVKRVVSPRSSLEADRQADPRDRQRNASLTSTVIRLTSINSSKWIGALSPCPTALRNAVAQAFCPLSCRHSFILLNPGQP